MKFQDILTTRLARAEDWVSILNRQVSNFYNQSTFGKTTFTFETISNGPSDGWFQLDWNHGGIIPGVDGEGFFAHLHTQRTIDLVEQQATVDFSPYQRLLIVTNSPTFSGNAWIDWYRVTQGGLITLIFRLLGVPVPILSSRYMSSCSIHEWMAGSISADFDGAAYNAAHELGHALYCKDHYGDQPITVNGQPRDVITPWSVMGITPGPVNNYKPTHHLGWSKYERGWLVNDSPGSGNTRRIRTVGPPIDRNINEIVVLKPQEILRNDGAQLILVPFRTELPFHGYVLENRSRLNGDEGIPETGVLITLVDQSSDTLSRYLVLNNPRFPTDVNKAPLKEHDSFRDEQRDITIQVERRIANDYHVRVQYNLPPSRRPNPIITPWCSPPWETPDIWFDSEKNGWGTYRYHDASNPHVGNGDDPWLNHENRIYVRIRNSGPGDATNVRVQVYVSQPPSIGDARQNWTPIGTIVYPIIRGMSPAEDYIPWTPRTNVHTCVKAEIQPLPEYIDMTNKTAQENIAVIETSQSSPWKPINIKTQIHNPYSKALNVHIIVTNVPDEWAIELDSSEIELPANGSSEIDVGIYPSGSPTKNNQEITDRYKVGFLAKPRIEAWIRYQDYFKLLGGVEAWVHLVDKTKITLDEVNVQSKLVTVSGYVMVSQEGLDMKDLPVAVEIRQKEEKKYEIFHTRTDGNGHFKTEINSPYLGPVSVQCFLDGTDTLSKAESNVYEIEIL